MRSPRLHCLAALALVPPGRRQVMVFAGMLLLVSTRTLAQEYASDQRGTVRVDDNVSPDVPAAQVRAALKADDSLIAILKRTELFRNPIGVNISVSRDVIPEPEAWQGGQPFYYGVTVSISYMVWKRDGKGARYLDNGPTMASVIQVNGIPCVEHGDQTDTAEPDSGPPVSEGREGARITGQFRGRPVYGQCFFITSQPGSPIVPLTKERYLRLKILRLKDRLARNRGSMADEAERAPSEKNKDALAEKAPLIDCDQLVANLPGDAASKKTTLDQCRAAVAQGAKQMASSQAAMRGEAPAEDSSIHAARVLADTGGKTIVRRLEAQLAAMSPAERRRQAAILPRGTNIEDLADVDSVDALPLVQLNPHFFNTALSPIAPQVIAVSMPGLLQGATPVGFADDSEDGKRVSALGSRFRNQLDWTAIEALVRRSPK